MTRPRSASAWARTRAWLTTAAALACAAALALACTLESSRAQPFGGRMPAVAPLQSLDAAGPWFNAQSLTAKQLQGKVVLIDFWTYSCINCLRTLPHVRAWAQKYREAGLVVIGVHSPEFEFEKRADHVQRATGQLLIDFPVVMDSDHHVWRAFGNWAWPGFYFVDSNGRVRHQRYGEGRYEQSEQWIRELLTEAGQGHRLPPGLASPVGQGTQAAAGPVPPRSQETYLGYARSRGFDGRGAGAGAGVERHAGTPPDAVDHWSLAGDWRIDADRVVLDRAGGRIAYRFFARDLHLVLGPATDGKPVRFRVRVDGGVPGVDHGSDIDAQGRGTAADHRLYQLLRRQASERPALFEIEFLDPGAQAFAFTFG
jgi:thiol-disulfide isomerase/thioredoxin